MRTFLSKMSPRSTIQTVIRNNVMLNCHGDLKSVRTPHNQSSLWMSYMTSGVEEEQAVRREDSQNVDAVLFLSGVLLCGTSNTTPEHEHNNVWTKCMWVCWPHKWDFKLYTHTHTYTTQSPLWHNYMSVFIHTRIRTHQPGGDIDEVGWSFQGRNK